MKSKIKYKVYSEISEGSVFYREGFSEQVLKNLSPKLQPLKKEKKKKGLIGILGTLFAFILKFKFIFLKLKFLLVFLKLGKFTATLGTMLIAIFIYAKIYGWVFGIGFITLIFAHEMGHYIAAERINLPVSAPVFIPFVGAVISMKKNPKTVEDEAFMAFAGPAFGTLATLLCIPIYFLTGSNVFLALLYSSFLLNLFNLVPVNPLDGGRVVKIISPKLWLVGIPILAICVIKFLNPILILILILGISEVYKYFKNSKSGKVNYYDVEISTKITYALLYFGLVAILAIVTTYINMFMPVNL
ncbi:site-2 protease family protein [Clostridium sp. cel8]|uniref:site-2 protease family protein n=1 Tax=Clostridium sp. cel8 TaxID=2663123 RepID=UPI001FAC8735|nr:site-2 protease family protein [Clostridium sp. cel8]